MGTTSTPTRILVFGAGPLGSLLAARLHETGHDVDILARGQRLEDLREHGIVIQEEETDEKESAHVDVVKYLGVKWFERRRLSSSRKTASSVRPRGFPVLGPHRTRRRI